MSDAIVLLLHVYPFAFAISAHLPFLLAPKAPLSRPLSWPNPPSTTYTQGVLFTSGRRNAPSLFPLWWWNERKRTKMGWGKRGRKRRRGSRGLGAGVSSSLTTLPWNKCRVPTPSFGEQAAVALCSHLTQSISRSVSPLAQCSSHMNTLTEQSYMNWSSADSDYYKKTCLRCVGTRPICIFHIYQS